MLTEHVNRGAELSSPGNVEVASKLQRALRARARESIIKKREITESTDISHVLLVNSVFSPSRCS